MTQLVAILNITPDSFSGDALLPHQAISQFEKLLSDGADIIDIGAESTRPNATPLDHTQEWQRLSPLTEHLEKNNYDVKISIDSYHPKTLEEALNLGIIDLINDISGLTNPQMVALAKQVDLPIVMMHSLSIPADPAQILPKNISASHAIISWAEQRCKQLSSQGIARNRLILDPGIGFGKSSDQSWQLIEDIAKLSATKLPLYYGHSRKSFLSAKNHTAERDQHTLDVSKQLIQQGVDYLRVHNVRQHRMLIDSIKDTV